MNNSLVSICVTSYNNAHYIIDTLNSIEKQTYKEIELIIVDDCSIDNSVTVIDEWLKQTSLNHKFIKNNKNIGVCKSVNILLNNCTGRYISAISSDDLMLPEKIMTQVNILENSPKDVGLVYSDAYLIGPKNELYFGKFIQRYKPDIVEIPQGNLLGDLLEGNFIPFMSILWKKECFAMCGLFDESLLYEDFDMLLRASHKYKFVFSDFISVKYRLHNNNLHKRLSIISWAESNFKIYFKNLGAENKIYDSLVQQHLRRALIEMYSLKSKNIKVFFAQYYEYFRDDKILKLALSYNLPYYQLLRLQRVFLKLGGNVIL